MAAKYLLTKVFPDFFFGEAMKNAASRLVLSQA